MFVICPKGTFSFAEKTLLFINGSGFEISRKKKDLKLQVTAKRIVFFCENYLL